MKVDDGLGALIISFHEFQCVYHVHHVSTCSNAVAPAQLCRPWIICKRISVYRLFQLTGAGPIIRPGKAAKP